MTYDSHLFDTILIPLGIERNAFLNIHDEKSPPGLELLLRDVLAGRGAGLGFVCVEIDTTEVI